MSYADNVGHVPFADNVVPRRNAFSVAGRSTVGSCCRTTLRFSDFAHMPLHFDNRLHDAFPSHQFLKLSRALGPRFGDLEFLA